MLKNFAAFLLCLLGALPATAASRNSATIAKQAASETTLAAVRRSDAADRDAKGNLKKLAPAEHMRRAAVYLSVRAFAEARDHWQTLIDNYPEDPRVPEALTRYRALLFSKQGLSTWLRDLQSDRPKL